VNAARRRRLTLPLTAWVTGGVALTTFTILAGVWLVLQHSGMVTGEYAALLLGAIVGTVATIAAMQWSRRVTTELRTLHANAVRRLRTPSVEGRASVPEPFRLHTVLGSQELADLARVLDALQLRARVSDEVAEQARRAAENASVGMFELLSGLVAAEEATRGQLSAELHDTVAQSLMLARSLLSQRTGVGDTIFSADEQERLKEYVEDAEEQVRAVMARARPPQLRDGDLASAVGGLRRDMATRYLLEVRVSWPEEPYPLPLVSAVTIYRFFQEALLNVVKHADVDVAEATLSLDGDRLVATVRDEGAGFDPGTVRSDGGRHVGLGLLRERARLAGGSLDVESGKGRGTVLSLRLPLTPSIGGLPGARTAAHNHNGASGANAHNGLPTGASNGAGSGNGTGAARNETLDERQLPTG
jgi:two-component system, NarL family, sensor histidine kinase UhpB